MRIMKKNHQKVSENDEKPMGNEQNAMFLQDNSCRWLSTKILILLEFFGATTLFWLFSPFCLQDQKNSI